jgi:amidase
MAIPCGMTASGLPVGIQIAGKPRGEAALISAARAIEEIIGTWTTGQPAL